LHRAIGYVTPHDMLAGRQPEIHAARDRKLEQARHQRQLRRAAVSMLADSSNTTTMTSPGETEAGSGDPHSLNYFQLLATQIPFPALNRYVEG